MAKIKISKITNANVYLDGVNLLGRAEEVTLPEVTQLMVEHKGLGMVGRLELPSGGIDKMTATIKWGSFDADVLRKSADPRNIVQLQVRAQIETFRAQGRVEELPVICFLSAAFKKVPLGTFKQHEPAEYSSELAVYYVRLMAAGRPILEVDVFENIYKVDGEDLLTTFRRNIGG